MNEGLCELIDELRTLTHTRTYKKTANRVADVLEWMLPEWCEGQCFCERKRCRWVRAFGKWQWERGCQRFAGIMDGIPAGTFCPACGAALLPDGRAERNGNTRRLQKLVCQARHAKWMARQQERDDSLDAPVTEHGGQGCERAEHGDTGGPSDD